MKKLIIIFILIIQSLLYGFNTEEKAENATKEFGILPVNLSEIFQGNNPNIKSMDNETRIRIFSELENQLYRSVVQYNSEFKRNHEEGGLYGQFQYVYGEILESSGGVIFMFDGKKVMETKEFIALSSDAERIAYYCSLIAYVHIGATYVSIDLANNLEKYGTNFEKAVIAYSRDYMNNFINKMGISYGNTATLVGSTLSPYEKLMIDQSIERYKACALDTITGINRLSENERMTYAKYYQYMEEVYNGNFYESGDFAKAKDYKELQMSVDQWTATVRTVQYFFSQKKPIDINFGNSEFKGVYNNMLNFERKK